MMNKKRLFMILGICCILAAAFILGVTGIIDLNKKTETKESDRLIGVLVTTEYPVPDISFTSRGEAGFKPKQGVLADREPSTTRNEVPAEYDFSFPGIEGIRLFNVDMEIGDHKQVNTDAADEEFSRVSSGYHFSDKTHNGTETTTEKTHGINGTLYYALEDEEVTFFCSPIYLTADGEAYLGDCGSGSRFRKADIAFNNSSTFTKSASNSYTEDGETISDNRSIGVTVQIVRRPVKITLCQLNAAHEMIQADEYQPGEMPRDIIPLAETAMILVDTENMPEDGKENHTCDAYSRNDSNFYTLQYKENGYCLSNYHVLKWQDLDRAADLTWKVENGTLTISGHGNMDNYDDKPAPWNGMNYSRLVVEEGIASLGYGAFRGNDDLREINLPESLITIGPYAFSDCDGLTDITIPSSVTEIEYYAFSSCSHLRKVTLPDSVTFINTCAFHQCVGLEHINLPASVKDFGIKVFDNCGGLKSITVAEGSQAEYYCKEDKLPYDYGEGTPVMTPGANTSITWKIEDDTLFITGTGDMDDYRTRFIADNRYGTNAPWNEEAFSKVVIGEGITSIGEKAFSNNDTLVSATLPDSLNKIGNNAFYDCENLEEVNLPKRLETIGENAFYYCTSLKNLTLPVSLKMIGFSAFQCCFALKEVIVPNNAVMVISYDAFSRCTGLEKVVLPATVKEIRNRAFDGCTNLQEIVVEKGSYAEQYCIDNNLPCTYSN